LYNGITAMLSITVMSYMIIVLVVEVI